MTARTVKKVADILQLLQRLPEMPSAKSSPLFNQDSSLATPLVFSNFVANYGSLVPDNYQVQSEGQTSPSDNQLNKCSLKANQALLTK